MSERHAVPLPIERRNWRFNRGLPTTIEAFHLAWAEREKVLAERGLRLSAKSPNTSRHKSDAVAAQIEAHRQASGASFDQRVAAGVTARFRKSRQAVAPTAATGCSAPVASHIKGELFSEVEALADQAAGTEDEHEGNQRLPIQNKARPKRGHRRYIAAGTAAR